jgi:hypothetical protein
MKSIAASIIVLAGAVCFSAGVLTLRTNADESTRVASALALVVGALLGLIGLVQWLRSHWPGSSGMS